ncbi:MAG: hypothetical protein ACK52T_12685, partial [Pseudanabaena sp.]
NLILFYLNVNIYFRINKNPTIFLGGGIWWGGLAPHHIYPVRKSYQVRKCTSRNFLFSLT